jgi:hypothetical protein
MVLPLTLLFLMPQRMEKNRTRNKSSRAASLRYGAEVFTGEKKLGPPGKFWPCFAIEAKGDIVLFYFRILQKVGFRSKIQE